MPDYICPIQPIPPVSQPFIPGQHFGIDFAVGFNVPILAIADGEVAYLGNEPGGAGIHTNTNHANGVQARDFHMSDYVAGIYVGMPIVQGQVIGYSGSTGASTGPHLHHEHHINGVAVDPAPYMNAASGPSHPSKETGMKIFYYMALNQMIQLGVNGKGQLLQSSYSPDGKSILLQDKILLSGLVPGNLDVVVGPHDIIHVAAELAQGNNAWVHYEPGQGWFDAFGNKID